MGVRQQLRQGARPGVERAVERRGREVALGQVVRVQAARRLALGQAVPEEHRAADLSNTKSFE